MRGQYLRLGRHVYHLLSVRLKYNHTDEKTQVGEPWSREPGEGAGGRAPLFAVLQGVLDPLPHFRSLRHVMRPRSEEHTSELQSLMRISYAVSCLKKKTR